MDPSLCDRREGGLPVNALGQGMLSRLLQGFADSPFLRYYSLQCADSGRLMVKCTETQSFIHFIGSRRDQVLIKLQLQCPQSRTLSSDSMEVLQPSPTKYTDKERAC
jgi:hypothetical protein